MGKSLLSEYWGLVYRVMQYAVDESVVYKLSIANDHLDSLTEEKFLGQLYVRFGAFEDQLVDQLLRGQAVVWIIGGRGCGKTSAIRFARREITANWEGYKVLVFDAEKMAADEIFDETNTVLFGHKMLLAIRRRIQQEAEVVDRNAPTKMLAWLLAGLPDRTQDFDKEVLAPVQELSTRLMTTARIEHEERKTRFSDLYKWFREHPSDFAEYNREADALLQPVQVLLAATHVAGWRRVILMYDNVDRIPLPNQARFRTVVSDVHRALSGVCSSAIAIREETVLGEVRPNPGGSHVVVLALGEDYPAFLMPEISKSHIETVFDLRFRYANDLYERWASSDHVGEAAVIPQDAQSLHAGVVGQLLEGSFNALANNNVRVMCAIYLDFVRYLAETGAVRLLSSEESADETSLRGRLQTLFYIWLGKFGARYNIRFHDVLKHDIGIRAKRFNEIAAENHLLMTCIWNLTHEGMGRLRPPDDAAQFSLVFKRMASLGFTLGQTRAALSELTAQPGQEPRMVEFCERLCEIDTLDVGSSQRLTLTRMGEALVGTTYHKFGYIWSLAERSSEGSRWKQRSYFDMTRTQRLYVYLNYVRGVAGRNLRMLSFARTELAEKYGDQWLNVYREHFAVDGKLLPERILESGESFLRHSPEEQARISSLREAYASLMEQLRDGREFEELDLEVLEQA